MNITLKFSVLGYHISAIDIDLDFGGEEDSQPSVVSSIVKRFSRGWVNKLLA